jgi:hypothetical protein
MQGVCEDFQVKASLRNQLQGTIPSHAPDWHEKKNSLIAPIQFPGAVFKRFNRSHNLVAI